MNYEILGLIVGASVVVFLLVKYALPLAKNIKYNIDAEKLLDALLEIALIFGNDEQDIIVTKVYDALLDTYDYALTADEADIESLLDYVISIATEFGVEIGNTELEALEAGCKLIYKFL